MTRIAKTFSKFVCFFVPGGFNIVQYVKRGIYRLQMTKSESIGLWNGNQFHGFRWKNDLIIFGHCQTKTGSVDEGGGTPFPFGIYTSHILGIPIVAQTSQRKGKFRYTVANKSCRKELILVHKWPFLGLGCHPWILITIPCPPTKFIRFSWTISTSSNFFIRGHLYIT